MQEIQTEYGYHGPTQVACFPDAMSRGFRHLHLYFSLLLGLIPGIPTVFGQVGLSSLRVNGLNHPYGIHPASVRMSWQLQSVERNVLQTAYELRLSTEGRKPIVVWSSGKIVSGRSVDVPYAGPALKTNTQYQWQVRVWDQQGKVSPWSASSRFLTGYASIGDWQASWISPGFTEDTNFRPSPLMRREFMIRKPVERATLFITAQGMYEARINGKRAGDAWLTPGWTSYNKRLQYQAVDVTSLVQKGANAIGVILGNGWYRGEIAFEKGINYYGKQLGLLAQLHLHYTDGSSELVATDNQWKSHIGEIRYSEIYHGETIDRRLHQAGWDQPGYSDTGWYSVQLQSFDKQRLLPTINEPVKLKEVFKPKKIFITPNGETVIDFGQNLVGWVRIRMQGKAGDSVVVTHAEVLDKQGNMYYDNLRAAKCQNVYITNGKGEQEFHPHFSWQGFRYAAIKGYPGVLTADNIEAVALYSDMEPAGSFTTSHPLINQLQHNIQWGQRGNFLDVPTDCPQRDERLGWTGDAQAFARTATFNFGVRNFFAKWLQDLAADQINGTVPFVIPNVLKWPDQNSAGWADAATIIPWTMYLAYGDTGILKNQFASMKAYVESIRRVAKDNLWNSGFHFGDWLFYRPDDDNDGKAAVTDKYLIAQCFYAHSTELLVKAARVLGYTDEARQYDQLLQQIKAAFQQEYVTGSGRLVSNTQTAYVLALQFDMLPEAQRQQAADRLAANVGQYGHITTGFLGTPYICHVLTRFGYKNLAVKLLLRENYPSWLYPVKMGATTIWERWDGQKPDSSFQTPGMNSFNHYAYGAIGDWLYRVVAGLDTEESAPGYRQISITPHPVKELGEVYASLQTPYGLSSCRWLISNGQATLEVVIPVNTTASIAIPTAAINDVRESGRPLSAIFTAEALAVKVDRTVVQTGSGTYTFSFPYKD